jgi:hypothetical protein
VATTSRSKDGACCKLSVSSALDPIESFFCCYSTRPRDPVMTDHVRRRSCQSVHLDFLGNRDADDGAVRIRSDVCSGVSNVDTLNNQ